MTEPEVLSLLERARQHLSKQLTYVDGTPYERDVLISDLIACVESLHDDAQAMALVKKFNLKIVPGRVHVWLVMEEHEDEGIPDDDLNRAIMECVAKMQQGWQTVREGS